MHLTVSIAVHTTAIAVHTTAIVAFIHLNSRVSYLDFVEEDHDPSLCAAWDVNDLQTAAQCKEWRGGEGSRIALNKGTPGE